MTAADPAAVEVLDLAHRYGERVALAGIGLEVHQGEIFALLGPNGSGKSTLFRVLSTLVPPQNGTARILGFDVALSMQSVRHLIGVVFQSPSLDVHLTVGENLAQQAALYGLTPNEAYPRCNQLLHELGLVDRRKDLVKTLSGGLRRRVELVKGLLHRPKVLLMDEPSTGLDPGARNDLWNTLQSLRSETGVTIMLTTHLLEEAYRADRIAILDQGHVVALDTPTALCESVGGDSVTITSDQPDELQQKLAQQFSVKAYRAGDDVRFEVQRGHEWVAKVVDAFPEHVRSIRVGQPTLEDVFIQTTGHSFETDRDVESRLSGRSRR